MPLRINRSPIFVPQNFKHGFGKRIRIPRFKELDYRIIKIIPVNLRARSHDRHPHRHEFHDFCAVSFVAKRISPLRNDAEIGCCHHHGYLVDAQRCKETNAVI